MIALRQYDFLASPHCPKGYVMSITPLSLDTRRLLDQIKTLGAIGTDASAGGRTRIALTDAE